MFRCSLRIAAAIRSLRFPSLPVLTSRTVQQLLGHTSIQTTARYTHPDMQVMRTAVEELKVAISALR